MSEADRMRKLLAASPDKLAQVDAILNDKPKRERANDEDVSLLSITETARRLNVSRPTVYALIRNGRLDVVKLDSISRVRLQSIIDFANGGRA